MDKEKTKKIELTEKDAEMVSGGIRLENYVVNIECSDFERNDSPYYLESRRNWEKLYECCFHCDWLTSWGCYKKHF